MTNNWSSLRSASAMSIDFVVTGASASFISKPYPTVRTEFLRPTGWTALGSRASLP